MKGALSFQRLALAVLLLFSFLLLHPIRALAADLAVTSVASDGAVLTIRGTGLVEGNGKSATSVFLGRSSSPLVVTSSIATEVLAILPANTPPGSYLLTVGYGLGESQFDQVWITLGAHGPQGEVGPKGDKGDKGDTGAQGPQGPVGATGTQGPVGATGAQGPVGATGAQGPVGATGAQGPVGATGAQGPVGATGAQGPVGATGAQGPQGPAGATGVAGVPGAPGTPGDVGPVGPPGPPGPSGAQGIAGNLALAGQGCPANQFLTGFNASGQLVCGSPLAGLLIKVEGHADVLVTCAVGDYSCQARQVCSAVTGTTCLFQSYDCAFGNQGSWYPPDGASGESRFNFAFTYDFALGGNYGNICACTQSQMSRYGLAATHQYCGLGHWTRQ